MILKIHRCKTFTSSISKLIINTRTIIIKAVNDDGQMSFTGELVNALIHTEHWARRIRIMSICEEDTGAVLYTVYSKGHFRILLELFDKAEVTKQTVRKRIFKLKNPVNSYIT